MSKMLRERGGELELRMEKIKGGKLMIDHEANTFKVVSKDENEWRRLEMSGQKLRNCPFCGGEASYTDNFYGNGTGHCVFCEDCGAGTAILTGATPPEELKALAYRDWNRRVDNG